MPVNATVNLQRILEEWEFSRQQPVLAQKVHQLQGLRLRGAPELTGLIDGYMKALTSYLNSASTVAGGSPGARSRSDASAQIAHNNASRRLDDLDAQRETLRLQIAKNPRTP